MVPVDWNKFARNGGASLRAVIDPDDLAGYKNTLIDRIHWQALSKQLGKFANVLSFGCGIGRFASRISSMGNTYIGVDSSDKMIRQAKILNNGNTFIHSNGEDLPFHDNFFDVVISVWVFQYIIHTDQEQDILKEIRRVLRPDGKFLLIEQVSNCGKTSGTVDKTATKSDYIFMLEKHFTVNTLINIRSSVFTYTTNIFLNKIIPRFNYFSDRLITILAKYEMDHIYNAKDYILDGLDYYDILIVAKT
jgi:ubiquinone/menaquinone biosynthesis C-methylase UbiE